MPAREWSSNTSSFAQNDDSRRHRPSTLDDRIHTRWRAIVAHQRHCHDYPRRAKPRARAFGRLSIVCSESISARSLRESP
jgi:hypothetical protein